MTYIVYVFELKLVSLENGTSQPNCGLGESEYFHIVVFSETSFPRPIYIKVYVSLRLYGIVLVAVPGEDVIVIHVRLDHRGSSAGFSLNLCPGPLRTA